MFVVLQNFINKATLILLSSVFIFIIMYTQENIVNTMKK